MRRIGNNDFIRELTTYPAFTAAGQALAAPQSAGPPGVTSAAIPKPSPTTTSSAPDSPRAGRLRELEQLRKEGLITQQEYEEKRKAVLSTL